MTTYTDQDAKDVMDLQQELATERQPYETKWENTARLVEPDLMGFNYTPTPGQENRGDIYDEKGPSAAEKLTSGIISLMCPEGEMYQSLESDDEQLNDNTAAARWFDAESKALFADRYAAQAKFSDQNAQTILNGVVLGNGATFIDAAPTGGIRYAAIPLPQAYWADDDNGTHEIFNRRFQLTARQAKRRLGEDTPQKILTEAEKNPSTKFWFIHSVRPNEDLNLKYADHRGMKFASRFVCEDLNMTIQRGGYRTMPYAVLRFRRAAGRAYGVSPSMRALPAIRMLNQMKKDYTAHTQELLRPVLLTANDGILSKFKRKPGSLAVGGLDARGNPLVRPLETGGNPTISRDLMEQERAAIDDTMMVNLLTQLIGSPEMNQLQVMELMKERAHLLGPSLGSWQQEYFGIMTERELDIRASQNRMTQLPPELADRSEYKVHYSAPLNRAIELASASGAMSTVQQSAPLIELDPTVKNNFDLNKIARKLAKANGASDILNDEDAVAQQTNNEQQMQTAAAGVQAAPQLGKAIRDIAAAQAQSNEQQ